MTEQLNLQPTQQTFPKNAEKIDVIYNTNKSIMKASANSYDNWEYIDQISGVISSTDANTYAWEFPSNRKHISNQRLCVRFTPTIVAPGTCTYKFLSIVDAIKSVKIFIGATQIGSSYTGKSLFMYWMNNLNDEEKYALEMTMGGIAPVSGTPATIPVATTVTATPYDLEIPILCPGNTLPLLKSGCASFPLHLLNAMNKKYRIEITFDPIALVTLTPSTGTAAITINYLRMKYSYTASEKYPIGPQTIIYDELKEFTSGSVTPASTFQSIKLDQLKSPSELINIMALMSTSASTSTTTRQIEKFQLYFNTDKAIDIVSGLDYFSRYIDRKGVTPTYYLGSASTKYTFYNFSFAKHNVREDVYDYYSPGLIVNNLQNFYVDIADATTTAMYPTFAAVYRHELTIGADGEPKLESNF